MLPMQNISFIKIIFDASLQMTGEEANIVPVLKKGGQYSPANYRPTSLTYVWQNSPTHHL